MRGEVSGPSAVVIGVGVNIAMPQNKKVVLDSIDQPWVDLESILAKTVERNSFIAFVINELFDILNEFPRQQKNLLEEWQQLDILKGELVEVIFPDNIVEGVALGITPEGALRVQHQGKEMICHSGEVSIRRG